MYANLKNVVEDVFAKYGRLNVLLNNAHASKQVAIPHLKVIKWNIMNFTSDADLADILEQLVQISRK